MKANFSTTQIVNFAIRQIGLLLFISCNIGMAFIPIMSHAEFSDMQLSLINNIKDFKDKHSNNVSLDKEDAIRDIPKQPHLAIWCDSSLPLNLCGIIDLYKKQLVLEALYLDIEPVEYRDTVYYVVTDKTTKIGVVDDSFAVTIAPQYPSYYPTIIYPNSVLGESYQLGCSSYTCKTILEDQIGAVYIANERPEPYLYVREGNKFGLLKFDNSIKQPIKFNRIDIQYPSMDKRIRFEVSDPQGQSKFGFFNEKLDIAIAADYELAGIFKLGVAKVKKGNKFGFIDANGNTIIDFKFDQADDMLWHPGFVEPTAVVTLNGRRKLVGISGQSYDYHENMAEPLTYHYGLARIHNGQGKYSFIKSNGELLKPFQFDEASDFTEHYDNDNQKIIAANVSQSGEEFAINQKGEKITKSLNIVKKPSLRSGKEIYKMVCAACHQLGLLEAPKLGDKQAWKDRMAKGRPTLYNHAIDGINKMPPQAVGDIQDAEVKNAVDYMIKTINQ